MNFLGSSDVKVTKIALQLIISGLHVEQGLQQEDES